MKFFIHLEELQRNRTLLLPDWKNKTCIRFLSNGVTLPVYDRERTVCDCFQYRTKPDHEIFNKAVNAYAADSQKNLANLSKCTKERGVYKKMMSVMEVLLNGWYGRIRARAAQKQGCGKRKIPTRMTISPPRRSGLFAAAMSQNALGSCHFDNYWGIIKNNHAISCKKLRGYIWSYIFVMPVS